MVPGFVSMIDDNYHRSLIEEAEMHGYDWVHINYRGLRIPLKDGKPLLSYDFLSFREGLTHIMSTINPGSQVFLIGSSLGGNIAFNLLAEKEFDSNPQIAAAVML